MYLYPSCFHRLSYQFGTVKFSNPCGDLKISKCSSKQQPQQQQQQQQQQQDSEVSLISHPMPHTPQFLCGQHAKHTQTKSLSLERCQSLVSELLSVPPACFALRCRDSGCYHVCSLFSCLPEHRSPPASNPLAASGLLLIRYVFTVLV